MTLRSVDDSRFRALQAPWQWTVERDPWRWILD
jgi:hypothetical protein